MWIVLTHSNINEVFRRELRNIAATEGGMTLGTEILDVSVSAAVIEATLQW